jgi:phosphoribosylformylglycinamidine synthase
MMFAGNVGVSLELDSLEGEMSEILFNEELGAVIQVANEHYEAVVEAFEQAGLKDCLHHIGGLNDTDELTIEREQTSYYQNTLVALRAFWSSTTHQMQRLRDNSDCADEEQSARLDINNPGISPVVTFDINEDVAAPFIATGAKPKMAILREQGVNGQVEMAAAFDRAGFTSVDVHMSDIISGRVTLEQFKGLVACGGFSYGDVLGAGEGWAKSILFNSGAREQFSQFFNRDDTFSLGICNGCQMLSNLKELIPGTDNWPHFVRNRSEQFEGRVCTLEIQESPSIFLQGMQGSKLPIAVAHGEGRAQFDNADNVQNSISNQTIAARYVDNYGKVTQQYPFNPNGATEAVASMTSVDGRVTIMMPHPERVFRSIQHSWAPSDWQEDSPWMRMFRNARVWVG